MDLGCGPGLLAIAFAPVVGEVIAIDPNAEMLAAGRAAAEGVGGNISFVQGSSNDLGDAFGRFRLVTMGRSFHWMDRADTLKRLDAIVEPDGAVALFDVDTVGEGARRLAHAHSPRCWSVTSGQGSRWRSPDWVRHAAFLIASAFSVVDGHGGRPSAEVFPAAQLVDRAFSLSRTSPEALGPEKAAALAVDLRALAAQDGRRWNARRDPRVDCGNRAAAAGLSADKAFAILRFPIDGATRFKKDLRRNGAAEDITHGAPGLPPEERCKYRRFYWRRAAFLFRDRRHLRRTGSNR